MRLLACLFLSAALHLTLFEILFQFAGVTPSIPTLSISPQQKSVHLQMRTRAAKKAQLSPAATEEAPKPQTPPPIQKITEQKNTVQKNTVKKNTVQPRQDKPKSDVTPKKERPKTQEDTTSQRSNEQRITDNEYVSSRHTTPRLIEHAEYLSNPPPQYPDHARLRRHQGTVTLIVDISARGSVTSIRLQKSSGFSSLDQAAKNAVAKWKFTPATAGTKAVASRVIVPVQFKLG